MVGFQLVCQTEVPVIIVYVGGSLLQFIEIHLEVATPANGHSALDAEGKHVVEADCKRRARSILPVDVRLILGELNKKITEVVQGLHGQLLKLADGTALGILFPVAASEFSCKLPPIVHEGVIFVVRIEPATSRFNEVRDGKLDAVGILFEVLGAEVVLACRDEQLALIPLGAQELLGVWKCLVIMLILAP